MPLSSLHERLAGMWKAIVLLVAIFTAGISVGAAAGGLTKLPQRVAGLEQQALDFTDQLEDLNRNVAAIRRSNQQTLCLTIAERQHSDWRKCID